MARVTIKRQDDPGSGNTVSTLDRDTVISVLDDNGKVQSQVRLSELQSRPRPRIDELPIEPPASAAPISLPDSLPDWVMSLDVHNTTCQRTAVYRCLHCGGEHEEYRTNPRDLPYAKVCGCIVERTSTSAEIEKCTAPALRRVTLPGEGVALNARRFEQLSVYEVVDYERKSDDYKRTHQRFYVPGRNNEPTEPGMIRHDITNIASYNKFIKNVNAHEVQKMSDHREMHRLYWDARRHAMRDDVNARIRHEPLLLSLARLMRKRSDQKSNVRYGKPLDSHFHAQLIEFNQGNIQDFCAEDTGWKSRRAK